MRQASKQPASPAPTIRWVVLLRDDLIGQEHGLQVFVTTMILLSRALTLGIEGRADFDYHHNREYF